MTHLPTGIVIVSKSERCQLANRRIALETLKQRLRDRETESMIAEQRRQVSKREQYVAVKIKTYNFHTNIFTDHRVKDLKLSSKNHNLKNEIQDAFPSFQSNAKVLYLHAVFERIKNAI